MTILGIILRVLKLEVSVYNVYEYITNQFPNTFAGGGGGGAVNLSRVRIARSKTLKNFENFVWISSKNSASGLTSWSFNGKAFQGPESGDHKNG